MNYVRACSWEVRRCEPLGVAPPPGCLLPFMYLLYLDDSGSVQNPDDRHIILAGLAVFERQPHWFSEKLDAIAAKMWPENPSALEFRGTDIIGGKKHWRGTGRTNVSKHTNPLWKYWASHNKYIYLQLRFIKRQFLQKILWNLLLSISATDLIDFWGDYIAVETHKED